MAFNILKISLLIAVSTGSLPSSSKEQSPQLPLVVERAWIEPIAFPNSAYGQGYVVFRNSGNRTITAWSYWAEIRFRDGSTRRNGNSIDNAEAEPILRTALLLPGRTFTAKLPIELSPDAVDLAVTPAAVVFDDDTTQGDETFIGRLFARRIVHQRFWHELQKVLDEVTPKATSPDVALLMIEAQLAGWTDSEIRNTAEYAEARRRIAATTIFQLGQSPAQVVEALVRQTIRRRADADAHAQRRR